MACTAKLVRNHIANLGAGMIFSTQELLGLGTRNNIDQCLSRMCRKRQIDRLASGTYVVPDVETEPPSSYDIAQVKARAFSKTICQANGDPHVFMTDGANSSFKTRHGRLHFQASSPKKLKRILHLKRRTNYVPSTKEEPKIFSKYQFSQAPGDRVRVSNCSIRDFAMLNRISSTAIAVLTLLAGSAAKSKNELPICPPLSKKSESKQTLPAIKLDRSQSDSANEMTNNQARLQQAEDANCLPLPLMPSVNETEERRKLMLEAHQNQLRDLWSAAIERSSDIQYVISVLQPSTDRKHATAQAMKLVGSTLFNLGATVAPTGPVRMGNMGSATIAKLFKSGEQSPPVSVGETLVLYKFVRDKADDLVVSYRSFRMNLAKRAAAEMDCKDIESARDNEDNSAPSQLAQFEYTWKKARRDLEICDFEVEQCRQKLVDLCGVDAIAKLETQIRSEQDALAELIGRPDIAPALSVPKPSSANK